MTSLSIDERLKAFQTALELKHRNVRSVDIFNLLRRNGLPIKYETVRSWVTGARSPLRKLNLVRSFDGDLVELIGMSVGDGSWYKVLKGKLYCTGRVSGGSIDHELATRVGRLMANVLEKSTPYKPYWSNSRGVYIVECGSKHFVELLHGALKWFVNLIQRYPVRFLRGIYNAEGCVTVRLRRGRVHPRIILTNSDSEILDLTRKLLRSIGVRTTLEVNTRAEKTKKILGTDTTTRLNVYNICIGTRENVLAFARLVGFGTKRKDLILRKTIRKIMSQN